MCNKLPNLFINSCIDPNAHTYEQKNLPQITVIGIIASNTNSGDSIMFNVILPVIMSL